MFWRFLIIFSIITILEIYFLQAVKTFVQDMGGNKRNIILWTAYFFAVLSIVVGVVGLFYPPPEWNAFFKFISSIVLVLAVCKLFGIVFLLLDDIIRLFRWIVSLFMKKKELLDGEVTSGGITRLKFLSQVAITFTVIPAVSFLYGMVRGAYKYRVHNAKITSPNIPEEFNGFKIVQISDIHIGSFLNNHALIKAFGLIADQKPDMILFTGDLVNNLAEETNDYLNELKLLKAPYGVYSVLGNHDYGDYKDWHHDDVAKKANLDALKKVHSDSGWKLMMNEHVPIEKNGAQIGLIGIENWGGSHRFPRYGKLDVAYKGAENYPFKILMSHDPSHWDLQVRKEYPKIDLTLSGHTHGMQFGIEIPGFKWSPIQYLYKQWAGLYKQGDQYLYVNRGLGFLGYPGRLGIWPEITVIELQHA